MDGVDIESNGDLTVVVVRTLSTELQDYLRSHLNEICFGSQIVVEDRDYYSFEQTVREFLHRFDSKHETTQIGMIGELLTHVLSRQVHGDLTGISMFFNKEERSIKKGFDLTFLEEGSSALWYAEVKSSGQADPGPSERAADLVKTAFADLQSKLSSPIRRSLWDAAVLDAAITATEDVASTAKALLRTDYNAAISSSEWSRNALLAAGVFRDVTESTMAMAEMEPLLADLNSSDYFAEVRVLAIQKSTFQKIVEFLRAESEVVT